MGVYNFIFFKFEVEDLNVSWETNEIFRPSETLQFNSRVGTEEMSLMHLIPLRASRKWVFLENRLHLSAISSGR